MKRNQLDHQKAGKELVQINTCEHEMLMRRNSPLRSYCIEEDEIDYEPDRLNDEVSGLNLTRTLRFDLYYLISYPALHLSKPIVSRPSMSMIH